MTSAEDLALEIPVKTVFMPALALEIARGGFKRATIAQRVRVDASIVTLWASCARGVPVFRLPSLALALEIPLEQLLFENDVPRTAPPLALDDQVAASSLPSAVDVSEVPVVVDETELLPTQPEPLRRSGLAARIYPGWHRGALHPAAARRVEIGVDGTPMGPPLPTFCSCGHRVR